MSLKNFLKSPFVKKLVYFTCKPYPPNKPSPKENKECKKLTTHNFSNQMTPSQLRYKGTLILYKEF